MVKLNWFKMHPLTTYFIVAYLISWFFMVPLALTKQGIIKWPFPFSTHYLAAYGPIISAVIVTLISSGKSGLKQLLKNVIKWKVQLAWWFIAITPIIAFLLLSVINKIVENSFYDIKLLGEIKFLPNYGIGALFIWVITFGLGEETGWRGFALPRLQKNRSALSATIILWIFWSLWHLPAFFYLYNTSIVLPFLAGQFAGTIFFTWLYNSTSGSILMVTIFHGAFNFVTASKAGEGLPAAVLSSLVILWAILVIIIFKPANLSHREKQVVRM
jgi:membrane protease YdiL (CAAX protease family)